VVKCHERRIPILLGSVSMMYNYLIHKETNNADHATSNALDGKHRRHPASKWVYHSRRITARAHFNQRRLAFPSHESEAFSGLALVIIHSKPHESGQISITAKSPGLKEA